MAYMNCRPLLLRALTCGPSTAQDRHPKGMTWGQEPADTRIRLRRHPHPAAPPRDRAAERSIKQVSHSSGSSPPSLLWPCTSAPPCASASAPSHHPPTRTSEATRLYPSPGSDSSSLSIHCAFHHGYIHVRVVVEREKSKVSAVVGGCMLAAWPAAGDGGPRASALPHRSWMMSIQSDPAIP